MFPPCTCVDVKIPLKLAPVVASDEDDRGVTGHVDEPVDPEIPFPDGGLVGGQVAVDDEQVGSGGNGIGDEPFEAAGGIAKVAVFVQMNIAAVSDSERHF